MLTNKFTAPLLQWYDIHGRKDLPWQHPRSPYYVWLSEVMLQQTQVKTVIPYFERFITKFPTIELLAKAKLDEVLALWAGLGYYSRGRNLHRCAQKIEEDFKGIFPNSLEALKSLPGIGDSTAAAISSLAFNQPTAILDGNVKRVLCRFFAIDKFPDDTQIKKQLWDLANQCMAKTRCADYTQAIMDLGATCCTRSKPNCAQCPLVQHCQAYQQKIVNTLPIRKSRAPKPTKDGYFILLHQTDKSVFVEQNKPQGIWGGLWCLPSFQTIEDGLIWLEKLKLNIDLAKSPWIMMKHSFTHFHLNLFVYRHQIAKLPSGLKGKWINQVDVEERNIGLPKPIERILCKHTEHTTPDCAQPGVEVKLL